MTDLSKRFHRILHDLIVAKLETDDFHVDALTNHDNFSNRKQGVKVNDAYSSWKDIFSGAPQGSILGSLLSSKNLCDLFYFLENLDIASNADDTKIYTINKKKKKRQTSVQ